MPIFVVEGMQTRIFTIYENIRPTIVAPNRPTFVIFVNFATAFDKMWHAALISNLFELDMPLNLIRLWLQRRSMTAWRGYL